MVDLRRVFMWLIMLLKAWATSVTPPSSAAFCFSGHTNVRPRPGKKIGRGISWCHCTCALESPTPKSLRISTTTQHPELRLGRYHGSRGMSPTTSRMRQIPTALRASGTDSCRVCRFVIRERVTAVSSVSYTRSPPHHAASSRTARAPKSTT